MRIAKPTLHNLRFLIAEVADQVKVLDDALETRSELLMRRVLDRSGYAHNLKMRIHDSCQKQLSCDKAGQAERLSLRALEFIATDLERITELCRDCVKQMGNLHDPSWLEMKSYRHLLRRVAQGLELVEPAIRDSDTPLALRLGRIEQKQDRDYRRLMKRCIKRLKGKRQAPDMISALFVGHAMEQMGDALLGISESVLSANLGQPLNIDRYFSLQESVAELAQAGEDRIQIETIAETRSGSGVSGIARPDGAGFLAIYKDGEKRKLKEERQGVESWHEIYPGLAPRILSYRKRGQSAALLIEHLAGLTFEQILLREAPELLTEALQALNNTLQDVWKETRTPTPAAAGFMRQTLKRLDAVYSVHPEFRRGDSTLCGQRIPAFQGLAEQAQALEQQLQAPFSVYIHGDFNLDNILYDPVEQRINFIDLHRSCYMDYVQDVSVFMVSNYRLQILDAQMRRRIMGLALDFHGFARGYAERHGDTGFDLRLALGLARSFATSTRFILDKALARNMFLRARYLIERALACDPNRPQRFRLPIEEIFIG